MVKRLQNRVAESRWLLLVAVVYATVLWVLYAFLSGEIPWVEYICFALTTYLLTEVSNSNSLIHTYNRMVSCSYVMMTCMVSFLFCSISMSVTGLCLVLAYAALFQSYQDHRAMGWIFYTFAALGTASLFDVRVLYYVPVFWAATLLFLISLNLRTFLASIIGIVTPYWFVMTYFLYHEDIETPIRHFASLVSFGRIADLGSLSYGQWASTLLVVAAAIIGAIHFIRKNAVEKIRTRMLYSCLMFIVLASVLFLIVQPQLYDLTMTIMILSTSPLIGHFIALTHTKLTNITFIALAALTLVITIFNIVEMVTQRT